MNSGRRWIPRSMPYWRSLFQTMRFNVSRPGHHNWGHRLSCPAGDGCGILCGARPGAATAGLPRPCAGRLAPAPLPRSPWQLPGALPPPFPGLPLTRRHYFAGVNRGDVLFLLDFESTRVYLTRVGGIQHSPPGGDTMIETIFALTIIVPAACAIAFRSGV